MYHPKHKKSFYERLCNSVIDDELSSIDLMLYMTYYNEDELRWIKVNDPRYKPLEYYEDEVYLVPIIVCIILVSAAVWLCYLLSIPNVK